MRARVLYAALRFAGMAARRVPSRPAQPLGSYAPGVSVVIPERSNPAVLSECLENLQTARGPLEEPSEVLVIASGSPRSVYRDLANKHPQVRWIFSKKPLWYADAISRGLRAARYDWAYLLNSDTLLAPLAIQTLLQWRSNRVFAIASQVFFRDPASRREETGWTQFRSPDGPIEILDEVAGDDTTVRGTFYAGGGAALFRRELLLRLARDSSAYAPFYWEDVEWGARAWRLGYESLYCPASRVCHLHRMTNRLFFSTPEIDRILARNRFIFHLRNWPSPASFSQLLLTLSPLDPRSLREMLAFPRIARIALGQFQSCRLPANHIALDCTWNLRYGPADCMLHR